MKIIDKIHTAEKTGKPFFSLEFFPPRTPAGAANLVSRFDRMSEGEPLFIDITWGAGGGDPGDVEKPTSSLSIASTALTYCGLEVMLHLTCAGLSKKEIRCVLGKARKLGIRNILALRGDAPEGEDYVPPEDGFVYGKDLVSFIRSEYGDEFSICVAGYPNGHPDATSYEEDILYLKEKVDAGADFIITQLFFEADTFLHFVNDCRNAGIACPILPGILPIQGYASLRHLVKLSKLQPPQWMIDEIEPIKDDDEAIRDYGVDIATKLCRELLDSGMVDGFHFYTLNREVAVKQILKNLGIWNPRGCLAKSLPWKTSANERRSCEDVRPIFWSCRPKSYIHRTQDWDKDDFPNGRWGDSSSPAFGDLKDLYLFKPSPTKKDKAALRKQWGEELIKAEDVYEVFAKFIEGSVKQLPWHEVDTLHPETVPISERLSMLNRHGFLTINSQPAVNGCSSNDEIHGWGGANGFIYKKAYLEFFVDVAMFKVLREVIDRDYPLIQYHAMNSTGEFAITNGDSQSPTAVTWGVFPGKEVLQPTVVDPVSFSIWREEAFAVWKTWSAIYEPDSASRKLLDNISSSYLLVNLIDNDYVKGNIFDVFDDVFTLCSEKKQNA